MNSEFRILVPRYVDADNTNAQNLNAKALLSRFASTQANWIALNYHKPDPQVAASPQVELKRLFRTRLWQSHTVLLYQEKVDAIFYPGMDWFDFRGLQIRSLFGRSIPVIATLEGLVGDEKRERELEPIVGHRVFCHSTDSVRRIDSILNSCDHIIAISPMLAKVARKLYGDKVSDLPLGIDTKIFHPGSHQSRKKVRVIGVGTLTKRKRPELFLQLGRNFSSAQFVWFGDGPLLSDLRSAASTSGLHNVTFRGAVDPATLGHEYRNSDLFVLPSFSEGSPKVLQEAAACGIPRIAFGFYEPPIRDGVDGLVAWTDEELYSCLKGLIDLPEKAKEMGVSASLQASKNDWAVVAPLWESTILAQIE